MIAHNDVNVGMELVSTEKTSFQRALAEGESDDTSTPDDEYKRGEGYAGAFTSSYVLCGYMAELMVNNFGDGFLKGGEISLKYIDGGVQHGDPITCQGVVSEIDEVDDQLQVSCDIWMHKFHTKKVVVGRARAYLEKG